MVDQSRSVKVNISPTQLPTSSRESGNLLYKLANHPGKIYLDPHEFYESGQDNILNLTIVGGADFLSPLETSGTIDAQAIQSGVFGTDCLVINREFKLISPSKLNYLENVYIVGTLPQQQPPDINCHVYHRSLRRRFVVATMKTILDLAVANTPDNEDHQRIQENTRRMLRLALRCIDGQDANEDSILAIFSCKTLRTNRIITLLTLDGHVFNFGVNQPDRGSTVYRYDKETRHAQDIVLQDDVDYSAFYVQYEDEATGQRHTVIFDTTDTATLDISDYLKIMEHYLARNNANNNLHRRMICMVYNITRTCLRTAAASAQVMPGLFGNWVGRGHSAGANGCLHLERA